MRTRNRKRWRSARIQGVPARCLHPLGSPVACGFAFAPCHPSPRLPRSPLLFVGRLPTISSCSRHPMEESDVRPASHPDRPCFDSRHRFGAKPSLLPRRARPRGNRQAPDVHLQRPLVRSGQPAASLVAQAEGRLRQSAPLRAARQGRPGGAAPTSANAVSPPKRPPPSLTATVSSSPTRTSTGSRSSSGWSPTTRPAVGRRSWTVLARVRRSPDDAHPREEICVGLVFRVQFLPRTWKE